MVFGLERGKLVLELLRPVLLHPRKADFIERFEDVEGGEEEGTRSAGWIENRHAAKRIVEMPHEEVVGGLGEQVFGERADVKIAGDEVVDVRDFAGGDPVAEVSPEDTYDAMNQSGDESYQMAEAGEEGWDGSFVNGDGETLTITQSDEQTISFSFAVSGISGSASINGDEAFYNGDDGTNVVFENAGGSMEVSVTDSEGQSISATISGSFMRQ